MSPSLCLATDSPLLTRDPLGLRPDVRLWCGERLDGGLVIVPEDDGYALVFDSLEDCLAFVRRWM